MPEETELEAPAPPDGEESIEPEPLPDEVVEALTERFGEDFSIEELEEFHTRREGWVSKYNDRLTQVGAKEKELTESLAKIAPMLAERDKPKPEPKPQRTEQPQALVNPNSVMQALGIKITDQSDWNAPVDITPTQLYSIVEGILRMGKGEIDKVGGRLSEIIGEVPEGGKIPTLVEVNEMASRAASSHESFMKEMVVTQLQEEYEYADRDDILRAIDDAAGLDNEEFDEKVREAAKRSHSRVDEPVRKAKATTRKAKRGSPYLGQGTRAGMVAGKKPPPLHKPGGVEAWVHKNVVAASEEVG